MRVPGAREDGRYARQEALPGIGEAGQRKLAKARVLVAGCGALGSSAAELLARGGVGTIDLVDFDLVELTNLQRQALIGESDVGEPKARAVADALRRINSTIHVNAEIGRLDVGNVERLVMQADLVVDGFDNLASRYLLNDACVKHSVPWVFAAVAGTCGMTMPILPGQGPCLRCLFPTPAQEEKVLTAQNAGLINTIPRAITALQVTHAIRILLGSWTDPVRLEILDVWDGCQFAEEVPRSPTCPACAEGRYDFLEATGA